MIQIQEETIYGTESMFCFQCEQTAGCTGCTGAKGVCGKTADTARLQDELTGALIGLSHAADENTPLAETTWKLMVEGLFATLTNVSFDDKAIAESQTASTRKSPASPRLWRLRFPLRT